MKSENLFSHVFALGRYSLVRYCDRLNVRKLDNHTGYLKIVYGFTPDGHGL